jgi:hypothetical protein
VPPIRPTNQTPPASALPLRWALILLGAFVATLIFGPLTYVQFGLPAGILAGLAAGGATVRGLHELLGP